MAAHCDKMGNTGGLRRKPLFSPYSAISTVLRRHDYTPVEFAGGIKIVFFGHWCTMHGATWIFAFMPRMGRNESDSPKIIMDQQKNQQTDKKNNYGRTCCVVGCGVPVLLCLLAAVMLGVSLFVLRPAPTEQTVSKSEPMLPDTEIAARVGAEAILACDVIAQARRFAVETVTDRLQQIPPEEAVQVTPEEYAQAVEELAARIYPDALDYRIRIMLLYNDAIATLPRANIEALEELLDSSFDTYIIPSLLEEYEITTQAELQRIFEDEYGSTLERERLWFIRQSIAIQWRQLQIGDMQEASAGIMIREMREFYEANIQDFEIVEREEARHMPFLEAQMEIRERIQQQRTAAWMNEYLATLETRFPIERLRPTMHPPQNATPFMGE